MISPKLPLMIQRWDTCSRKCILAFRQSSGGFLSTPFSSQKWALSGETLAFRSGA